MTPAEKAGLKIGKKYRVADHSARTEFIGKIVTFVTDDGSKNPWFSVEGDSRERCFQVADIEPVNEPSKKPLHNYIIDVTDAETTVKVGKILSADQIKRIIEVMGE